jgi:hypothetical protein
MVNARAGTKRREGTSFSRTGADKNKGFITDLLSVL